MGVPLGNVGIFVLGDLMQMCPISGRYIFLDPRNEQFLLFHELDPLWKKFQCINLEINHRQGEDKDYAEMLNLIRIGKETHDDIGKLKEREIQIIMTSEERKMHFSSMEQTRK